MSTLFDGPRSGAPAWREIPRKSFPNAALLALIVLASACGGGDGSTNPPPTVAPVVTIVSGDGQRAIVTRPLDQPLVVRVTRSGVPVSGATVSIAVTLGGGSVSSSQVTTDAGGLAQISWTLGASAGSQSLTITASSGGSTSPPVVARATADAARLAVLHLLDGNEQTAVAGTAVHVPPAVTVRDEGGAPLAGIAVRFEVTLGGGSVEGADAITNASGIARATTWTLGATLGTNTLTARVTTSDVVATPIEYTADGVGPGGIVSMPSRTYTVAAGPGGTVTDTASGVQFRFPGGGVGELAVSRVLSGPLMPGDSTVAVRVSWSGTAPVQVLAPRTEAAEPQLFVWGVPQLTMETPPDSQWMPIGTRDLTGDVTGFTIPESALSVVRRPRVTAWASSAREWWNATVAYFYYTADQKAFLRARVADAANVVPAWIAAIEDDQFREQVISLYGQHNISVASGYTCPSYYTPVIPNPTIYFCVGSGRMTKSGFHEAGHYVTDLLLYQAGKSNGVLSLAPGMIDPSRSHDWGDTWMGFRKTITEDYAFFSEWMGMGKVGGSYPIDGTDNSLFWAMTNSFSRKPSTVDFPSMEGFGIAYIGGLMRTDASKSFHNFNGDDKDPVPIAGITKEKIVGVFAKGPKNITEFNTAVRQVGPEPAIQVIAERLGWSYHGSGTIIDSKTLDSLEGVTVRPLIKAGEKWYETETSAETGSNGRFSLSRVFPGAQIFRLYKDWDGGTDSVDVGINVSWDRATTLAFQWDTGKDGVITASFPNHAREKVFSFSESYDPVVLYGNQKIHAAVSATIIAPDSSQTRGGLYYLEFFRIPWTADVPTRVSITATPTIGATSWTSFEGGVNVRYTLESMGCRAGRKPHSTVEVNLGASCSLSHELAPGAEGQSYQIYVTYSYVRTEVDEFGVPKPGTETRLQGERKMMEVYVW